MSDENILYEIQFFKLQSLVGFIFVEKEITPSQRLLGSRDQPDPCY